MHVAKIVFISIFLLTCQRCLYGQVDSVLLEVEQLQGSSRTRYVVEKMPYLFENDVKNAMLLGAEVYEDVKHISLPEDEKMKFIFLLGSMYSTEGLLDSANSVIDDLKLESQSDLAIGIAELLASYRFQKNDPQKAEEAAARAHESLSKSDDDHYYLVRATYSLASLNYDEGNYDESLLWINKTLATAQGSDHLRMKAAGLMFKGALLREKGEQDSVKFYLYKALEMERQAGSKKGIARVSNQLGIMEARLGNTDEALALFKQAMQMHLDLSNVSSYINAVNNVGIIHGMKGEYDSALIRYQEVLEKSEQTEDAANHALALGNIGSVLITLARYDEAVNALENSLEIYRELGSKPGISRVLNNLGNAYRKQKKYENALPYLKESLALKIEMGRKSMIGVSVHNIADLYRQMEWYDSAAVYFNRALKLKKEVGDKESIVNTYFGLGKLMRNIDRPEQSEAYLDSALVMAKEVGLLFRIRDIYEFQSGYYAERKDFERSYEKHVLYKQVYDSLFTTESESVVAELQTKFKTKEQQQQIALLEQKRQSQSQLVAWLTLSSVLLVLLIAVVFNRYRLKNRAARVIQKKSDELAQSNKELRELSEFKRGMTNMIAHDIKNPLNAIIGFSKMIEGKEGSEISKAGNAILRLVTNMLDVEKYESSSPSLNLQPSSLSDLIFEAKLAVELLLHDKSIQLSVEIENGVILRVDRDMMVRVLVNLLSNAIKYSPHGGTVQVFSQIEEVDGKSYVKLSISDAGLGISEEEQSYIFDKFYQRNAKNSGRVPSTGLGLAFCKMAVNAHDGSISVESGNGEGCVFHLVLEVEKSSKIVSRQISESNDVIISESDQQILSQYSRRLKALKVHNVSAIIAILDEIEGLNLQTKWPDQIRSAVQYSNKEQFHSLLEMIK